MELMALILAHATQDDVNALVNVESGLTPLLLASSLGSLALSQMLLWVCNKDFSKTKVKDYKTFSIAFQSKADVKTFDKEGRSCVTYARLGKINELVELLLNNGCPAEPEVSEDEVLPRRRNTNSRKLDFSQEKVTEAANHIQDPNFVFF